MKKHPIYKLVFIIGILLELFASYFVLAGRLSYASSEIIATSISQDTAWSKVSSPYFIRNPIYIEPGYTLTLEPGTIVKFAPGTGITVGGALNVAGTLQNKIYLTSLNDNSIGGHGGGSTGVTGPTDWSGITFISGSSSIVMKNISLRYSTSGIFLNQSVGDLENIEIATSSAGIALYNSSASLNGAYIHDLSGPAIIAYSGSNLSVVSSSLDSIQGMTFSVYNDSYLSMTDTLVKNVRNNSVFSLYNRSQAEIKNSTIKDIDAGPSGNALIVFGDSKLSIADSFITNTSGSASVTAYNDQAPNTGLFISNSVIDGGDGDGVLIYANTKANISSSTIKNFRGNGIEEFSDGSVTIDTSTISNNQTGLSFNDPSLTISTSSVLSNAEAGLIYRGSANMSVPNVWWGSTAGPYNEITNASGTGNKVSGNVTFTPWLLADPLLNEIPPVATSGSNVIFLPGLESSRLYTQGLLSENQLWEPNRNADVEKLYLNSHGKSIDQNIYTRDIINKTNILPNGFLAMDIYQHFSNSMDKLVSDRAINNWEAIPYDWRGSYDDLLVNGIKLPNNNHIFLSDEVEKMASSSKTHQVTIVAHSNGGLLAKSLISYLNARGKVGLIDRLILVAVPELGTPESIGALLHGDDQEIRKFGYTFMSKPVARNLSENMPVAYNLLPSKQYLNQTPSPIVVFDPSVDHVNNFRTKYGNNIKNYNTLSDFLLAKKDSRIKPDSSDITNPNILNKELLDQSAVTQDKLTSWLVPSGIKVNEIAGFGIPTTNGIAYSGKEKCILEAIDCNYILDHQAIKTTDGDGTVVGRSAALGIGSDYYLNIQKYNNDNNKNISHATILEIPFVEELIKSLVVGSSSSVPTYISITKPVDNDQNMEISVHSPVSIDAYDNLGNHTGLISSSSSSSDLTFVEENIPNSSYEDPGEGKYIDLPSADYSIKLGGLGVGSFTLDQKIKQGDVQIADNLFPDIPVTPMTTAQLQVTVGTSSIPVSVLAIDADGDGVVDATMTPAVEINPSYYLLLLKKTILTFNLDNKIQTNLLNKIDNVLKLIAKGKVKNATKKIQAFNHNLELKLTKQRSHRSKISKDDIDRMLDLLNKLLDNLAS